MTITIKHKFTSPKADGLDSTVVQPSNWNDEHNFEMSGGKILGRATGADGVIQELPMAFESGGQAVTPPSGTTAQRPASPAAGMMRYNTTTLKMEMYSNSTWYIMGGTAISSSTTPTGAQNGDLWFNVSTGQLLVYYGAAWVAPTSSPIVDTFSGDGSTVAFTLSGTPPSKQATEVYVNGIYIQKAAYSLSGQILTFSAAPALGTNNVEVNWGAQGSTTVPGDGTITTVKIADVNVTTGKLADGAVTTVKIADSNVTTAKILDANVTTAKIADANVTTAKIADANVTTAKIADANVTTAKIADGNITLAKMALNSVDTTNLVAASVTNSRINDGAVTLAKMASNSVDTSQIVNLAVTTGKINDAAVTTAKLASSAVDTSNIVAAAVTAPKLSGAQAGAAPIFALRAFVQFNGNTGGIRESGNIASVTRVSTGLYDLVYTTAMGSNNPAIIVTPANAGTLAVTGNVTSHSTTGCRIKVMDSNSTVADCADVSVMVMY